MADILQSYLDARQEWNERYGVFIQDARRWRQIAIAALGIAALSLGGMLYIANQPRQIPYIVEVDKQLAPLNVYPADSLAQHTPALTRSIIARWVKDFRGVSLDREVQRQAVKRVYAHLSTTYPAYRSVTDWYRQQTPFERAQEGTVVVEVQQLLQLSTHTWRLEWTELARSPTGEASAPLPMTGTMTVLHGEVTDETILTNPTGLYIQNIDWSQELR